ncbi:YkgJ family cysteine cluster protein [[Eubacterium] cellulosolvens]
MNNLKNRKYSSEPIHFPSHILWSCIQCGMCCGDTRSHRRRILLLEKEAALISRITDLEIDEFTYKLPTSGLYDARTLKPYSRQMRKIKGKCFFLQDHRCLIYLQRPLTCRFYPFSMQEKKGDYTFLLTDEPCEGFGSGSELNENFFSDLINYAKKVLKS